jgi:ribosomal protein S18 acetylase RimI-like enzyme
MTPHPIDIRYANADDFDAIRSLLREGDDYHRGLDLPGIRPDHVDYDRASYDAAFEDHGTIVMIANRGDEVAGFLRAEHVAMPAGRLHLERQFVMVHEIVVAARARGQGVGKRLVRAVEAWAAERKIASVELNVFTNNAAAREFYRELGFAEQMIRLNIRTSSDPLLGTNNTE